MKARVSHFAVLALCVSGLAATANAAEKAPRFNGPFHQNRNPLKRPTPLAPVARAHTHHMHHGPSYSSFGHYEGGGYHGPGYGYGSGYYPGFGVGTAYSSALFGQAELLRGAGEYNLLTSQAMINGEHARSLNMDNQQKYVATYFEKRRIHDEALAAEKEARLARAAANRAKLAAAPAHPVAVTVVKVDGEIQWPAGLLTDTFTTEREQLATLLTEEPSGESRQMIDGLVETMRTKLLVVLHGKQIKTMDYLDAKKFLASLENESPENHQIDKVAQR